jgi:hypothetical protein
MKPFEFSGAFDGTIGGDGFNPVLGHGVNSARHMARLNECSQLWIDVLHEGADPTLLRAAMNPGRASNFALRYLGERFPAIFNETMGTNDFTALTADVLDRQILGNYAHLPQNWRQICRVSPLRDMRSVKRFVVNGAEAPWSKVAESAPHTEQKITQPSPYTYQPYKYMSGSEPISFEAMLNDDLGIFQDLPARFANGGVRTIQKFVTELHIDASGPDATLYSVANANIIASNPVLGMPGLAAGLTKLRKVLDSGGDPIFIDGKIILEVGPDLEVTANNLMNQILVDANEVGGSANQRIRVGPWLVSNFTVFVNQYIPLVASSSNGTTTWCLFANPQQNNRPALEVGFVRGYDSPVLLEKVPNTARAGGGPAAELGDWNTMSREMKGLLIMGGSQMDPKMTVASNGSAS